VIVEYGFPSDVWEIIPKSFPTLDGLTEAAWIERLVSAYVVTVGEAGGQTRELVPALARGVRQQVLPDDVATVLFRPTSLPVTAVVHVQLFDAQGADTSAYIATGMIPDEPMAIPPVITPMATEHLGEGSKAAFIGVEPFPDGTAKGGISYVFATSGHLVNIQTSQARLDVIGILEAYLDEFVQTVRLVPGEIDGVEQIA